MLSADTNLFIYAANPSSPQHDAARRFFEWIEREAIPFATCELVLVEVYMQLRNPSVMPKPLSGKKAAAFCVQLRNHSRWQHVDYDRGVSARLWNWAESTSSGFRRVIDARIALTLLHHGIREVATANKKDFTGFDFDRVWNPLKDKYPEVI